MLIYVWSTALNKLISKGFETGDYEIYDKVSAFTPESPRQLAYISFSEMSATQRNMLIFNVVYLAAALIGFIAIMNLRTDKGN